MNTLQLMETAQPIKMAYDQGWDANLMGVPSSSAPDDTTRDQWLDGWHDAYEMRMEASGEATWNEVSTNSNSYDLVELTNEAVNL